MRPFDVLTIVAIVSILVVLIIHIVSADKTDSDHGTKLSLHDQHFIEVKAMVEANASKLAAQDSKWASPVQSNLLEKTYKNMKIFTGDRKPIDGTEQLFYIKEADIESVDFNTVTFPSVTLISMNNDTHGSTPPAFSVLQDAMNGYSTTNNILHEHQVESVEYQEDVNELYVELSELPVSSGVTHKATVTVSDNAVMAFLVGKTDWNSVDYSEERNNVLLEQHILDDALRTLHVSTGQSEVEASALEQSVKHVLLDRSYSAIKSFTLNVNEVDGEFTCDLNDSTILKVHVNDDSFNIVEGEAEVGAVDQLVLYYQKQA
jgi:hypothetical protein